jgi:hypothetical protein
LCQGDLVDTIINFGEDLPADQLEAGFENSDKADLCLVLGSSLTVSPACNMPEGVGRKPNGRLVICNLQKTPYDSIAAIRIYSKTDDLMNAVMQRLNFPIPPFVLSRRMKVTQTNDELIIQALDFDGTPATIFSVITCGNTEYHNEPFKIKTTPPTTAITLHFYGHYNEPSLPFSINTDIKERFFDIHYDPLTGQWRGEDKGNQVDFFQVRRRKLNSFQKIPQKISQTKAPITVEKGGFSVNPKTDCPHFSHQVRIAVVEKINNALKANTCASCNDTTENWMCLTCGHTFCSRYVKGDAEQHFKDSTHCISISFSDLSIWCYSCDYYITHQNLQGIVQAVSMAKFG